MKLCIIATLILLSFNIVAMKFDFNKDNPNHKVVRLRCVYKLGEFQADYLAVGHTPLYLYGSCVDIAQTNERECQAHSDLKESQHCTEFALQTVRQRCDTLYKKALDAVTNCSQTPDEQEKEIRNLKKDKVLCASSCNDMQKRCYFSDDFLLSSGYVYGPENRNRLCGLFNYLRCRNECANNYYQQKSTIEREWTDEKKQIEEAQFWNQIAKQRHNNPKV